MSILAIINEQASFGFSGRINILLKDNGKLSGVIFQYEGKVVGATAGTQKGKKALFHLIFDDVDTTDKYKYIVEPEIIGPASFMFELPFNEVKMIAEKQYSSFLAAKKFRPPASLKLLINSEIIVNDEQITPEEFAVLAVVTEYSRVDDVYQNCKLLEFEITNALVGLRKKRAIKVVNN